MYKACRANSVFILCETIAAICVNVQSTLFHKELKSVDEYPLTFPLAMLFLSQTTSRP